MPGSIPLQKIKFLELTLIGFRKKAEPTECAIILPAMDLGLLDHTKKSGIIRKWFPAMGIALVTVFLQSVDSQTQDSKPGGNADTDISWEWLGKILDRQYRGPIQSKITLIRNHLFDGKDTLKGELHFHDQVGERRLILNGSSGPFEFWSLQYGAEQWWKEPNTDRVRRIANRSWKKPALNTQMTFEDLLKIPGDFLLNYAGTQSFAETDSTLEWKVSLTPSYQSQYGALEMTVNKNMGQPTVMTFFNLFGKPLKTMFIDYRKYGKRWQWTKIRIKDQEGLAYSEWILDPQGVEWESPPIDNTRHFDQEVIRRIMGRSLVQPSLGPASDSEE